MELLVSRLRAVYRVYTAHQHVGLALPTKSQPVVAGSARLTQIHQL
jgi:hypothetical protein